MSIIANPLGSRGGGAGSSGKSKSVVWLTNVTGNGTFISTTNKVPIGNEVTEIDEITTDATTLVLTIVGDRGAEYEPTVVVNGVTAIRAIGNTLSARTTGTFTWVATIPASGTVNIVTSDNFSIDINVIQESPAIVSDLVITNNPSGDLYPLTQIEVKRGDPIFISFTTDLPIDTVYGLANLAGSTQTVTVPSGTNHTSIQLTCGSTTTVAALKEISINTRTTSGAVSNIPATSSNTILCNNIYPFVTVTGIVYPVGQTALKSSETANISLLTGNLSTVLYSSPNSELTIPNLTTDEPTKIITRASGDYNDSVVNFRAVSIRDENGSTTTTNQVIAIAHVAPTTSISESSPLQSGSNDGTSLGNYPVTITSNQRLLLAPTVVIPEGTLSNFTWSTTAKSFTATLSVADTDLKGIYQYGNVLLTGMALLNTVSFTGEIDYEFRGIKSRTIELPPFGTTVTVNATLNAAEEANILVDWTFISGSLTYTATNAQATNAFTIVNNTGTSFDILILDSPRAAASSAASTLTIRS